VVFARRLLRRPNGSKTLSDGRIITTQSTLREAAQLKTVGNHIQMRRMRVIQSPLDIARLSSPSLITTLVVVLKVQHCTEWTRRHRLRIVFCLLLKIPLVPQSIHIALTPKFVVGAHKQAMNPLPSCHPHHTTVLLLSLQVNHTPYPYGLFATSLPSRKPSAHHRLPTVSLQEKSGDGLKITWMVYWRRSDHSDSISSRCISERSGPV
jgi:hypothetical protein